METIGRMQEWFPQKRATSSPSLLAKYSDEPAIQQAIAHLGWRV
jgi:hypothetical protein